MNKEKQIIFENYLFGRRASRKSIYGVADRRQNLRKKGTWIEWIPTDFLSVKIRSICICPPNCRVIARLIY
jgi:hypothetical protein